MRISDWSSDVCSSDLRAITRLRIGLGRPVAIEQMEPRAGAEPLAHIVSVGEAELPFCDETQLHVIEPAIDEARRGGRAGEIGEGDAVVARATQRRRAIRSEEPKSALQSIMRK